MRALRETNLIFRIEGGLQRLFPDQCRAMSSADLYRLADSTLDSARRLGFDPPQYLGLAALQLTFGLEFWAQEEYAWAREILDDKWLWTPAHRLHELRRASVYYLASLAEKQQSSGAAERIGTATAVPPLDQKHLDAGSVIRGVAGEEEA